jgi:hypothetical protein
VGNTYLVRSYGEVYPDITNPTIPALSITMAAAVDEPVEDHIRIVRSHLAGMQRAEKTSKVC